MYKEWKGRGENILADIYNVSNLMVDPFMYPFQGIRKEAPKITRGGQLTINSEPCEGKSFSLKVLKCYFRSFDQPESQ